MPRLLDLFCCEGGMGEGFRRAGFEVTGVDIVPRRYRPGRFVQADALEYFAEHWHEYDAVHASPPCHDHSERRGLADGEQPDAVRNPPRARPSMTSRFRGSSRALAAVSGKDGSEWLLDGSQTSPRASVCVRRPNCRRHRLFESNVHLVAPGPCHCSSRKIIGVYGHGDGGGRGWKGSFRDRQAVMGIDWMKRDELAQAIPPAYAEWIGVQLLAEIGAHA